MLCSWLFLMNYSKRNKKKKTTGVALSVRCIEVAASLLLHCCFHQELYTALQDSTLLLCLNTRLFFVSCVEPFLDLFVHRPVGFVSVENCAGSGGFEPQRDQHSRSFYFSHYQWERDVLAETRVINCKCCFTALPIVVIYYFFYTVGSSFSSC